jgi:hypothetical protein
MRVLRPDVQNEERPGLACSRGAPRTRDAAGQGHPSRTPRARGRWRQSGRRAAATHGRWPPARRDCSGTSRWPMVAQAVRPAATTTPLGAGPRRGLTPGAGVGRHCPGGVGSPLALLDAMLGAGLAAGDRARAAVPHGRREWSGRQGRRCSVQNIAAPTLVDHLCLAQRAAPCRPRLPGE